MPLSILIYGHDSRLLETRAWVLERAGFRVLRTTEQGDVKHSLMKDGIDLFILCHTLAPAEAKQLLADVHSERLNVRSLVLTANMAEYPEDRANAVLSAFADPRMLIAKVNELARRTDLAAVSAAQ